MIKLLLSKLCNIKLKVKMKLHTESKTTCKTKNWKSSMNTIAIYPKDHRQEKDRNQRWITWIKYMFDDL